MADSSLFRYKIPVNATPNFYNDWSNQREDAYRLLGKERTDSQFGLYTELPNDGVRVSISADVPSTQPSMQAPLFCVEGAATLMDPTRPVKTVPGKPHPIDRRTGDPCRHARRRLAAGHG